MPRVINMTIDKCRDCPFADWNLVICSPTGEQIYDVLFKNEIHEKCPLPEADKQEKIPESGLTSGQDVL